ncbi:hypothetical protein L1887_11345 [Cichorium endivia]|nr:hypothetical protein L1887_11345 [Cichorium endivia]
MPAAFSMDLLLLRCEDGGEGDSGDGSLAAAFTMRPGDGEASLAAAVTLKVGNRVVLVEKGVTIPTNVEYFMFTVRNSRRNDSSNVGWKDALEVLDGITYNSFSMIRCLGNLR